MHNEAMEIIVFLLFGMLYLIAWWILGYLAAPSANNKDSTVMAYGAVILFAALSIVLAALRCSQ